MRIVVGRPVPNWRLQPEKGAAWQPRLLDPLGLSAVAAQAHVRFNRSPGVIFRLNHFPLLHSM